MTKRWHALQPHSLFSIAFSLFFILIHVSLTLTPAVAHDGESSAITIHSVVQSPAAEPSGSQSVIWLAGLGSSPDTPHSGLGVAFAKVGSGWFGPMWALHLVSDHGLLDDMSNATQSDVYPRGSRYITLSSGSPKWGHEYEVTLSYDPPTGAAAVVVVDRSEDRTVVARNMQLAPSDEPLLVEENQRLAGFVPAPVQWWIVQRDDATDRLLPTEQIDRQKENGLLLRLPWTASPGVMRVQLFEESGRQVAEALHPAGAEFTPIAVADLPAGTYTAALEFLGPDFVYPLDRRTITVGSIQARLTHYEVDTSALPRAWVRAHVELAADGAYDAVASGVQVSLVRHRFEYDPAQGRGWAEEEVVHSQRSPWTHHAWDDASRTEVFVEFPLDVPVDGTDDGTLDAANGDFWQLLLEPVLDRSEFLHSQSAERTWIGPSTSAIEWRPFLQDETVQRETILPGIEWMYVTGSLPAGPLDMHLVTIDLWEDAVHLDALIGGDLTTPAAARWPRSQPSQMVHATGAVVGVNSDFFDIRNSMTPRGVVMRSGELLKADAAGQESFGLTEDGVPFIGHWRWEGRVQKVDGSAQRVLHGLNVVDPEGVLSVFRAPALRSMGTVDPDHPAVEVVIQEIDESQVIGEVSDVEAKGTGEDAPGGPKMRRLRGVVQEVRIGMPKVELSPGIMVLSGRGQHGEYLREHYAVGDVVEVSYRLTGESEWPYLPDWTQLHAVASGRVVLLRDGKYGDRQAIETDRSRHPRTAVGISWDQRYLYILVVDGRSDRSVGMTYQELADFFRHVGAFHALNLDGGGSTALVVQDPTTQEIRVLNTPSDGQQRYVPVGLGVFWGNDNH